MRAPMTLQALADRRAGSSRVVVAGMVGVIGIGLNLPGRRLRFEVEGWEKLPPAPVLMVANHTHWLDWNALRWVGWWRGRHMSNWVKPRTYEEGYAGFLDLTGNIPLASRGYLLSADVREVHGRPPDEQEYRALRNHLDTEEPLPETPFYAAIQQRPRAILGLDFDPARATWRACLDDLFFQMMQATLAHSRGLCSRGIDLQIMPQGVTSVRLTQGHPGALQAAMALGLTVVPVGINNFPQCYGRKGVLPRPGGTVTVRVGAPYRVPAIAGHTPFLPSSERQHAQALREGTDDMMGRIAALLDPVHQPTDGPDELDVAGVARFV